MEPDLIPADRFEGCLLGLALGDATGAPYEGGIAERLLWKWIGRTSTGKMRWTDDTQMTIDVIESFLDRGRFDPDHLANRFASSYRWSRGYGPAAAKTLKKIKRGEPWEKANRAVYPDGSFGNGAAMRAPVVGLIEAESIENLPHSIRLVSSITHIHLLAIEGAMLVALATALSAKNCPPDEILDQLSRHCQQDTFSSRLAIAQSLIKMDRIIIPHEAAKQLGNRVSAQESSITAIYLGLAFQDRPWEEMQTFLQRLGGDVDTISAMAGAIWGAKNGISALPSSLLASLEQQERLRTLAQSLHQKVVSIQPPKP